ncbi:DUF4998 domain-containing protein [Leeuwenhoekiella sp. UBA4164]|uniref:DUF4998 domain-containing protein n=1 Tax=Leeuwenhoekiella sp. UBA4164 TaxID=1946746 RepID=UPI0025B986E0|nr:DUF4998 domain-containing protein [Leeuwenhoekiella sp. UBA4164]
MSCFTILWSCSDQEYDDYKKFANGGEINYTEKVDSLKAFSGKNRIMLEGIIDADPKITEFRVFWNDGRDSISVPVTRSGGVDTLSVTIDDMPENIYNFQVRTYDAAGNKSLISNVTGSVYGERYQNTLFNRPVLANDLVNNTLTISYASMDLTTGVIGTEVLLDGASEPIFVPIDSEEYEISDYVVNSSYKYRTLFLPEETAIDTFYTDYVSFTPIPKPILVNASAPFETTVRGGEVGADNRWGTLADWTTNDAAKTFGDPPVGGFDDNENLDAMGQESWGSPLIRNGKIHQQVALKKADYSLRVFVRNGNKLAEPGTKVYLTIVNGDGLPNVDNIENNDAVLGYKRVTATGDYVIDFTSTEEQMVSVGVVTDFTIDQSYWKIMSWDIVVRN